MRHHIRKWTCRELPNHNHSHIPLIQNLWVAAKKTSVFRLAIIYQQSPLIPVQANTGGVTHMNYKLVLESAPGQQCTHRASARGWRGKRETRPQHSSVFISAPPVGLNCAWHCARINQNLGESRSTAEHQGNTILWGRAQIGKETHRPETSAGSRRASAIHFSCVAEAEWDGTF